MVTFEIRVSGKALVEPSGRFARVLAMIRRLRAERHFTFVRWTTPAQGDHYPAAEVPELFREDACAFAAELSPAGKAG